VRTIIAHENQTLYDIALQAMGSVEGVFAILALNPFLRLDMAIPASTEVLVPDDVISQEVVDYYERNGIVPTSGLGEEVVLTPEEIIYYRQKLFYDLSDGQKAFDGIRLWNLVDKLTIQIIYEGITSNLVQICLDQSLDGINYDLIPGSVYTLDPNAESHSFNIFELQSNYVRGRIILPEDSDGIINEIIFRL